MRIKEGYTLRSLLGEHIVVGENTGQVKFTRVLSLNSSAAFLWEKLQGKDFTQEDVVALLLDEYDVTEEKAAEAASFIIDKWIEQGVIVQ